MPRFGMKAFLIAVAIIALWFATFSGFPAADDVRRCILLLILFAAGFAALYGRGRRRAFWLGFFLMMFALGGLQWERPLSRYIPEFQSLWNAIMYGRPTTPYTATPTISAVVVQSGGPPPSPAPTPSPSYGYQPGPIQFVTPNSAPAYMAASPGGNLAMAHTFQSLWILGLSTVSGLIAAYIYSRNHSWSSTE